jgi:triosephosphate isomerase
MRKKLIVGNWKMHLNTHQASLLLHKFEQQIEAKKDVEVVLCPNFLVLQSLSMQFDRRKFKLGAQNCYWRDEGAYTGEVSATMLRGLVDYVIVGHSERRHIFGEHDADVRQKVGAVVRNGMTPIMCVGETAGERAANETHHVLHGQVVAGLANLTSDEVKDAVIAYEPVWAIGTGNNATPGDVERAVSTIRHQVASLYGKGTAEDVRVLYGGSVDRHNAGAYLELEDVDGLLVGGASLKAPVFTTIVETAQKQTALEKSESK